ncbi:hypothetical protein JCM8202v2_003181 [Rhodotorula sphaerocarpa]
MQGTGGAGMSSSALGLSMASNQLAPGVPLHAAATSANVGGIGAAAGGAHVPVPQLLQHAVKLKATAESLLQSLNHHQQPPATVADERGGEEDGGADRGTTTRAAAATTGNAAESLPARARDSLEQCIDAADRCLEQAQVQHNRVTDDHRARALYILGWAIARRAQLVAPDALPAELERALAHLERATALVPWFPAEPPALAATPSVTRPLEPTRHQASVDALPMVPAWGAELVAEVARTHTVLALARAMAIQEQRRRVLAAAGGSGKAGGDHADDREEERQLADMIDLACRRNVQALFTPVDPLSSPGPAGTSSIGGGNASLADASTVLGNARLLRDVLSALLPYTTDPAAWKLRLEWATHIADVQFVSASLSANRLVDIASAEATKLQRSHISPRERNGVKRVLEKTARKMAPHEMKQGNVLLWLGRVMLDAVGAQYLGRTQEGFQAERRRREQQATAGVAGAGGESDFDEAEDQADAVPVPENDLLEATYCDLELLDNTSSPEVIELRSQRIERAVFINERLIALGDGASSGARSTRNGRGRGATGVHEDEMDESDREQAAEEAEEEEAELAADESDEEQERITRALGRARLA